MQYADTLSRRSVCEGHFYKFTMIRYRKLYLLDTQAINWSAQ